MQLHDRVKKVSDDILAKFEPEEMILFNLKKNIAGEVSSFKICAVIDTEDKLETEKRIYLEVESEIPFDILVYTPEEWKQLRQEKGSFASWIHRKGQYIYGDEK